MYSSSISKQNSDKFDSDKIYNPRNYTIDLISSGTVNLPSNIIGILCGVNGSGLHYFPIYTLNYMAEFNGVICDGVVMKRYDDGNLYIDFTYKTSYMRVVCFF